MKESSREPLVGPDPMFDPLKSVPAPVQVVMCLDTPWYELMWTGRKTHEFRRRFLTGTRVEWFVYLTAPESRLCAVIDLDPAIEGTPHELAQIAERMSPGSGATVEPYLAKGDRTHGYAMPIRRVREFQGFPAADLEQMVYGFHPPQGYVLVNGNSVWRTVCDRLLSTPLLRDSLIEPAS